MKNEIMLDKEALKVLASDTRIDILKKLDLRRMTITELSSSLNLSKATVHEHLTKLIDAGLVKKSDSHSNRVYYELMGNGVRILHPHKTTKIMLLLSSAISAFIGGFIEIYTFVRTISPKEVPPVKGIGVPGLEHFFFALILITIGVYLFLRIRKELKVKVKM